MRNMRTRKPIKDVENDLLQQSDNALALAETGAEVEISDKLANFMHLDEMPAEHEEVSHGEE